MRSTRPDLDALGRERIFESVPNFSEGRRAEVIDGIAAAVAPAHLLDCDPDGDHNRVVVSMAGSRAHVEGGLLTAIATAVEAIDMRRHEGVHPRVGAADVVPIVPLGATSLTECRELAHLLAERVWSELRLPVYLYGHGEGKSLADVRGGRAKPDLGGPSLHPTAGAVCIGARSPLVAFNVVLPQSDLTTARAVARTLREASGGVRGVQALVFVLPGARVQLSMNLFRLEETTPAHVIDELRRMGVVAGAEQLVGLCPTVAAHAAADGRLLEARLAAAAARAGASLSRHRGDEEHLALSVRLEREAGLLASLPADQDAILAGGERAAALVRVLDAGRVVTPELEAMLHVAGAGFRAGVTAATEAVYRDRVAALDRRLEER